MRHNSAYSEVLSKEMGGVITSRGISGVLEKPMRSMVIISGPRSLPTCVIQ